MYFLISDELIDREDLDISEKMLLVVISKYMNSKQKLDRRTLALKMGTSVSVATKALQALVGMGIIEELKVFDDIEDISDDNSETNVIKKNEDVVVSDFKFENFEPNSKFSDKELNSNMLEARFNEVPKKKEVPINEIKDIFDEVCTNAQAKILYELAGSDFNRLKEAYGIVKEESSDNSLEELTDYLQRNVSKDAPSLSSKYLMNSKQAQNLIRVKEEVAKRSKKPIDDVIEKTDTSKISEYQSQSEAFDEGELDEIFNKLEKLNSINKKQLKVEASDLFSIKRDKQNNDYVKNSISQNDTDEKADISETSNSEVVTNNKNQRQNITSTSINRASAMYRAQSLQKNNIDKKEL